MTANSVSLGQRLRWWQLRARRACPHRDLEGIYGDEITLVGYYRLRCHRCGRWLDGPVSLARGAR